MKTTLCHLIVASRGCTLLVSTLHAAEPKPNAIEQTLVNSHWEVKMELGLRAWRDLTFRDAHEFMTTQGPSGQWKVTGERTVALGTTYLLQFTPDNGSFVASKDGTKVATGTRKATPTTAASIATLPLTASANSTPPVFTSTLVTKTADDPVLGIWKWDNSKQDFTIQSGGVLIQPQRTGKWVCVSPDTTPRKYELTWDNGRFTDTLSLVKNGLELVGQNQRNEKLLGTRVSLLSSPATTANNGKAGLWVNLLPLINTHRDAIKGTWNVQADGLSLEDLYGLLELPYKAPEEYDFEIEFTRPDDSPGMAIQLLAANHHCLSWKIASKDTDSSRRKVES